MLWGLPEAQERQHDEGKGERRSRDEVKEVDGSQIMKDGVRPAKEFSFMLVTK